MSAQEQEKEKKNMGEHFAAYFNPDLSAGKKIRLPAS